VLPLESLVVLGTDLACFEQQAPIVHPPTLLPRYPARCHRLLVAVYECVLALSAVRHKYLSPFPEPWQCPLLKPVDKEGGLRVDGWRNNEALELTSSSQFIPCSTSLCKPSACKNHVGEEICLQSPEPQLHANDVTGKVMGKVLTKTW